MTHFTAEEHAECSLSSGSSAIEHISIQTTHTQGLLFATTGVDYRYKKSVSPPSPETFLTISSYSIFHVFCGLLQLSTYTRWVPNSVSTGPGRTNDKADG